MSYNYVIVTDSTANLPHDMIKKYEIEVLSLNYYVDGREIKGYEKDNDMDLAPFYQEMRDKKDITTSLVNVGEATDLLENIVKEGKDFIYIGFSSGLSGTFQAISLVVDALMNQYPERNMYAVDSLAAALGEGLLVHYAIENREQGMSLDDNACWLQDRLQNICHWFTVDDLFFLKRGGRISTTTAIVGTALSIKPVLHVDEEGHLIAMEKVRGRRKSLDALVKHMQENAINPTEQIVYISHGDCLEDAQYVADKIKTKLGVEDVMIRILDPVIGAHSGPGTVALFYLGTER